MKRLVVMLPGFLVAAGCVYPAHSMSGAYSGQGNMYARPSGAQLRLAALPFDRWDNVMMTAVGTPLFVLMMDGSSASGEVVAASIDNLRLHVASGEVDLAARDVMRVDRVSGGRDLAQDGVRGAAYGAAVVGVLGLIVGHVPPPRLFAAGGIIGANQGVKDSLAARGATTIYLARGIVPPGPGPVSAPADPSAPRMGPKGPCGYGGSSCNSQIRYERAVRR
jgi:hypothetical protein